MKIFKLLLLLTFMFHAESKLNIPKSIHTDTLNKIIKHGWDEGESTQKKLIIQTAQKQIAHFLTLAAKPIQEVSPTKKEPFPLPKILLNRTDYAYILAYCKYLESQQKEKESLRIYLKILEGLHAIKDQSVISIIFRMLIEKMCTESLRSNIHTYALPKLEMYQLKTRLDTLLLKNMHPLLKATERERHISQSLLADSLLGHADDVIKSSFAKIVLQKVNKLNKEYDTYVFSIKSTSKLLALQEKMKLKKEKLIAKYTQWEEGKLKNQPKDSISTLVSQRLFFTTKLNIITLILEMQNNIKENKKLLNMLEKK